MPRKQLDHVPQSTSPTLLEMLRDLTHQLESPSSVANSNPAHVDIRPADEKLFLLFADEPRTISQLARTLKISRQAAHASIGRLSDKGLVTLAHARGNRRDKIAVLTTNGLLVRALAQQKLAHVEARLETRIGKEKLETLRQILTDLLADETSESR